MRKLLPLLLGLSFLLTACNSAPPKTGSDVVAAPVPATMDDVATAYVKLVLALGEYDSDYVDAYHGPAEWLEQAHQQEVGLPQIRQRAEALIALLAPIAIAGDLPPEDQKLLKLRKRYLQAQIASLAARASILNGAKLSFDEEARVLYGVTAPSYTEADFDPILKQLDELLPKGPGSLADRYNRYLERFYVQRIQFETVFRAALTDAQYITQGKRPVPLGERVDVALAEGKSWSAYNWYKGDFVSRVELNGDFPIPMHRFIELAAHEGYPGHHIYNTLMEFSLVRGYGWVEYQVYPLFSPQSLIAEGTADFGYGLAFPQSQRIKTMTKLFKVIEMQFSSRELESYDRVVQLARRLTPAGIEAARRYLDGKATAEQTVAWLQRYTLSTEERAKQRVKFFDQYRSYVINYSYGEDIVRHYVEEVSGSRYSDKRQWEAFLELISTPQVPADLIR